jgi:hypothetical protein
MRTIPGLGPGGDFHAVVVRTDYSDEAGWERVRTALETADDLGWSYAVVEGPDWDEASADDICAATATRLAVVFVADRVTMGAGHPFLAIAPPGSTADPADYAAVVQFGREFRILPREMPSFHANVELGNTGFAAYAEVAQKDPDGVFRGFPA